jgi:NAD(P)-dependent dehydrogenase (short-subunit alcohol dehydrogenase family)
VLITGGSQGIGYAAAAAFARGNHRLALAGRSASHLEAAGRSLAAAGLAADRLMLVEMEVGAEASMRGGLDRLHAHWGDVDILVNNAGKGAPAAAFDADNVAMLRATLEVNLFGAAWLCQELLPAMRRRGWGRVVNVASTAGLGAPRRLLPYSVSKAALIALTRSLAVEFADQGIAINAVAPGPVVTDNYRAAKGESAIASRGLSIPAGRLADPGDVAEVIVFLASPGAAHRAGHRHRWRRAGGRAILGDVGAGAGRLS